MKITPVNLFPTLLKFGIVLGLMKIAVSFLFYATNQHIRHAHLLSLTHLLIALIIVFWAFYRLNELSQKKIKFNEILLLGFGISIISGILQISYAIVFTNFIDPLYEINPSIQNDFKGSLFVPIKFFIFFILNPIIGLFCAPILNKLKPKLS
jgi:hypothetical protein